MQVVHKPPPQALDVGSVVRNIKFTQELLKQGKGPEAIGTVCGTSSGQEYWDGILKQAQPSFQSKIARSYHEDLPTNQAFGLLYLWSQLKPELQNDWGSLIAFVFGSGKRSTPFTETNCGQKPAIDTFVKDPTTGRFLSMVEVAMQYFVGVQHVLKESGFKGMVVKWGDEVLIPTLDLSQKIPLLADADIVRFVGKEGMNADNSKNKDWIDDSNPEKIKLIPRLPIEKMEALADRGIIERSGKQLIGIVNVGSIAISNELLDALLEKFRGQVFDANADYKDRPDLDPQFFTALTIAAIDDEAERTAAWELAIKESADVAKLANNMSDILTDLREVIESVERHKGRKIKMVAMDFGQKYWGDIGQHRQIFDFYMDLNDRGPKGAIALALADLPPNRDNRGNIIVNSSLHPDVNVENSVLINVDVTRGDIIDSVLIGTRTRKATIMNGFDVLSTALELDVKERGGTYKVVSDQRVCALPGERLTTLFLPGRDPEIFKVHETCDLKDRENYEEALPGNPMSYNRAHELMSKVHISDLLERRKALEAHVMRKIVSLGLS